MSNFFGNVFRKSIQIITYILVKVLLGVRYHGVKKVPHNKAYIIASNHHNYLDPPIIGCVLPLNIYFAAKKQLFKGAVKNWFFRACHAIPVNRTGFDRSLIKTLDSLIKNDKGFVIFPEGTRSRTDSFLEPKFGLGMVAYNKDCLVIPCYISSLGSFSDFLFRRKRLNVYFGDPIQSKDIPVNSELSKKEKYIAFTHFVMDKVKELKKQHLEKSK